ncbi:hypothetical protein BDV37DRAFT_236663 [Aspergillus pseudonomiae]|uniref:Uncharacterized protein n=1 Tax=Aspergillus pseudonomiae TaxID=1506151 RepID=A0A5N7DUL2_9EURO|nr:uncharacterized protein BDV37DRAFT_236663 [Aspergillus pseudonomiae]KAE8409699.1 hypothetical protein BDV37DRAFT_236663 [Aspergillus pseudonomiae]
MSSLDLPEIQTVQTTLTQRDIQRTPTISLFLLELVFLRQILCGVIIKNRIYVPYILIASFLTVFGTTNLLCRNLLVRICFVRHK